MDEREKSNQDKAQPQVVPDKPGDEPEHDDEVQADREQGDELPRWNPEGDRS